VRHSLPAYAFDFCRNGPIPFLLLIKNLLSCKKISVSGKKGKRRPRTVFGSRGRRRSQEENRSAPAMRGKGRRQLELAPRQKKERASFLKKTSLRETPRTKRSAGRVFKRTPRTAFSPQKKVPTLAWEIALLYLKNTTTLTSGKRGEGKAPLLKEKPPSCGQKKGSRQGWQPAPTRAKEERAFDEEESAALREGKGEGLRRARGGKKERSPAMPRTSINPHRKGGIASDDEWHRRRAAWLPKESRALK